MSIKVMTYVWDGFPGSGSELLAMLALADWCNDHGGSLYPSVAAVAEKIRVGEKHARNILHKFVSDGFLAITANQNGGKPGTTRHYRLNVLKLKALADTKEVQEMPEVETTHLETTPLQVTPDLQFRDGSPVVTKTAPLEVTLTTIEPSIEPPLNTRHLDASGFEIPDFIDMDDWNAWHSTDKRKKATILQKQLAVKMLTAWRDDKVDHKLALENAAVAGWQGLFKPTVSLSQARTQSFNRIPNLNPDDIGDIPNAF